MPVQDSEPMGTVFEFAVHSHPLGDDLVCVTVEGEVDGATAPQLKTIVYDLIHAGNYEIVLNFDKVRYIDSTGMGVLVGALKRVREHDGRIFLICTNVRIQKLFTITGLSRVFDIFDDEKSLLAKFHPKSIH